MLPARSQKRIMQQLRQQLIGGVLRVVAQVDKTHYVRKVKQIPTEEGRNAELAVYRRKPEEAEAILLQAGLVYRAIKMNIKLFNFERALDLATQYKQHQDTVLHYRQQFLKAAKQTETITRFMQMNESVGAGRGKVIVCMRTTLS